MECFFNCFLHYFEEKKKKARTVNTEFLGQNMFDTPS